MSRHLIFVYNANSGWLNAVVDSAHKMLSPQTYPCKLCELTHDATGQRDEWRRFRESVKNTGTTLEFLHKDEFEKVYWSKWLPKYTYPIILEKTAGIDAYNDSPVSNSGFEILMEANEMRGLQDTKHLIDRLKTML
jgi:hypothetical protein